MRAQIVTLDDYIDAGLTLNMSARQTLATARKCGLRIRNAEWMDEWKARKLLREQAPMRQQRTA